MKTPFFTRKGDTGESSVGNTKVAKSSQGLILLGSLDECNSVIGLARSFTLPLAEVLPEMEILHDSLLRTQELLFIVQAEIAAKIFPPKQANTKIITDKHVSEVEQVIESFDEVIPQITHFIIPGESTISAQIDVARTISRRVEREALLFSEEYLLSDSLKAFLNRLSSLLFALARYSNVIQNRQEHGPNYS
ncbi:MAG: cob(I)yrinic acid a,c-diamide adenosyltransferase [Candidatus Dojkabacteria bacterium]|nr:MAG: cob(I)yrinic acid a,c-diamide adenosyltransferase [Candidatus Dojkabacteria bacterium]